MQDLDAPAPTLAVALDTTRVFASVSGFQPLSLRGRKRSTVGALRLPEPLKRSRSGDGTAFASSALLHLCCTLGYVSDDEGADENSNDALSPPCSRVRLVGQQRQQQQQSRRESGRKREGEEAEQEQAAGGGEKNPGSATGAPRPATPADDRIVPVQFCTPGPSPSPCASLGLAHAPSHAVAARCTPGCGDKLPFAGSVHDLEFVQGLETVACENLAHRAV